MIKCSCWKLPRNDCVATLNLFLEVIIGGENCNKCKRQSPKRLPNLPQSFCFMTSLSSPCCDKVQPWNLGTAEICSVSSFGNSWCLISAEMGGISLQNLLRIKLGVQFSLLTCPMTPLIAQWIPGGQYLYGDTPSHNERVFSKPQYLAG